jgi:signal transduction histidine kinase
MCRSFNPESELLAKLGIIQTLEYELMLLDSDHVEPVIEVKGNPCSLPIGTELITFRMLQEILFCIAKEYKRQPIEVRIIYEKNDVSFMIQHAGKPIEWKQFNLPIDNTFSLKRLPLPQRAKLIDAKLQVKYSKANQTCIKLIVPFKTLLYE